MTRKKIVTKLLDFDHDDDIIVFPQNRTLYVDQFTDEAPTTDEDRAGFKPTSMKDVFEHYRPKVEDVQLETEDGEIIYEDFHFCSIEDFDDTRLILQSELLSTQKAKMDIYNELIHKFQFLHEEAFLRKSKRHKAELEQWIKLFVLQGKEESEIVDSFKMERDRAKACLRENLYVIREKIQKLEKTYRGLDSFFANAGQERIEFLTLMNVNKDELDIYDSEDTLAIREELAKYYDWLSLKNNYSLLVIPGQFGENDSLATTIRMWAKTAYKNKVIMVTDFRDVPDYHMLKEVLEQANLQGPETYLANIIMTCNYLRSRKRSELADEEEDFFIPGSAALAGRLTNTETTSISEAVAGRKGILNNVSGVRLDLRKAEIASLIGLGMIPMVEVEGCTMAFSSQSLYKGATKALRDYPFVRTVDWIGKVIQYFINTEIFALWNAQLKSELSHFIHDFLSDYKGPDKAIDGYAMKRIEQDPITKDIKVVVWLKLAANEKYYSLQLNAHQVEYGLEWEQTITLVNEYNY